MSGPRHSATILNWAEPFARRVMARIHEYDDALPRPFHTDNVVHFPALRIPPATPDPRSTGPTRAPSRKAAQT
jgi:hypothetical protein